jgi:hypothetical protein
LSCDFGCLSSAFCCASVTSAAHARGPHRERPTEAVDAACRFRRSRQPGTSARTLLQGGFDGHRSRPSTQCLGAPRQVAAPCAREAWSSSRNSPIPRVQARFEAMCLTACPRGSEGVRGRV